MKALQGLFFLFAMSLLIISCGGEASNNSVAAAKPAPASETVKSQVAPVAKTQEEGPKELPGGITVESTTQTEEAPVDDANVDYKKLAASICKCGSKYKGHDDGHVGDVHVNEGDTEYQKEVDCAVAAKNAMTKGELSRQKLVVAIKGECHDIPGKLVMRVMMTLGK